MPDFKNNSTYGQHQNIAKKIARIVRRDLSVIGYFYIVNPLLYLENPQKAPVNASMVIYSNWSVLNVQYLIRGEYETSDGIIKMKANLISI